MGTWIVMVVTNISLPSSNRLKPLPSTPTDVRGLPECLQMGVTVMVALLFVILAVGCKGAHTWWLVSQLSKRPDAIQEAQELMKQFQASTCQHH